MAPGAPVLPIVELTRLWLPTGGRVTSAEVVSDVLETIGPLQIPTVRVRPFSEGGILLNTNNTRRIIGPSLMRGASEAGRARRHPFFSVCVMIYVWKGPGRVAPANPNVIPWST